jgi:hypothetical protein
MAPERRNEIILGVLTIVLLAVAYRAWQSTAAAPAAAAQTTRAQAKQGAPAPAASTTEVHLDALNAERPQPETSGRDLFRFKPKAPPPPPPSASRPTSIAPLGAGARGPQQPPSVPPIPLKFVGTMEQGNGKPTLGIFSDGMGAPMVGPEGGVLDGRYRILKIGAESAEIAYLDGRGRTTLRLSGG